MMKIKGIRVSFLVGFLGVVVVVVFGGVVVETVEGFSSAIVLFR
jgi:hypothetical protein